MADLGPAKVLAQLRREAIRGGLLLSGVSLACNLGALAMPIYNMEIFNRVMTTHNMRTLAGLSIGLVICTAIYVAVDHLRLAMMAALGDRFAQRVGPPMLQAVQAAAPHGPDPLQGIRDMETLRTFIGGPSLIYPFDLVWSPVLLLALLLMGWGYALVGIGSIVVLVVLNLIGDSASRHHLVAANEAAALGFREVAGAARSAEAVVALGMLPTLVRRWARAEGHAAEGSTRALLRSRAVTAATRALRSGMTGATVATGLVLVLNGYASSGTMVAANMVLARMLMPIEQFSASIRLWADAAAAWRRVRALLLDSTPTRYEQSLPCPVGHISVESLVYLPAGAERPVLRGVSFDVAPGEVVGIIGPSASGKSTLLRLVLGMVEPTSGGVFLDGHSTFLWNREDWGRHVGYVPQSLAFSEGTVAENIARGAIQVDLDAVVAAAKRADIHAIIADLPHGYATRIASSGFTMSAGQRQRLALARALYGTPKLVVLDEPNAFLDEIGEAMLTDLLRQLRAEGVVVLISAHRPSVLRAVDKLLVLQNGLISHFGEAADVVREMSGPKIRLVRNAAVA